MGGFPHCNGFLFTRASCRSSTSGTSLQQAALDLVDAYQQDPAPAIFEVVRLTLAISGSKYDVKIENLENMEIAEVVAEAADVDLLPEQCPVLGDIRRNFVR